MLIWCKSPYLQHFTPYLLTLWWPLIKKYDTTDPTQTNVSKNNCGWPTDRQTDNRRPQTDDGQTDIFELTLIHNGFFCVFVWEGENKLGEIYTSLLRLQGDKKRKMTIRSLSNKLRISKQRCGDNVTATNCYYIYRKKI
jgi:hypothetical protein